MLERTWILEDDVVDERAVVRTRIALDDMQLLGVRRSTSIEPELVVEADGVDDERVALPPADGMPQPRWNEALRMFTAIHVDDAMGAVVHQLVQDVEVCEP